jgi:uncharacterized membrane protein
MGVMAIHSPITNSWKLAIFYYNRDEPRLIVPKHTGLPFTLNFAKPAAWVIIGTIVALIAFAVVANNRF